MKRGRKLLVLLVTALTLVLVSGMSVFAEDFSFNVIDDSDSGTVVGTITLSATDHEYDGLNHQIGLDVSIDSSKLTTYEEIDSTEHFDNNAKHFKYAVKPTEYENLNGSAEPATGPKDVGEYKATVRIYKYTATAHYDSGGLIEYYTYDMKEIGDGDYNVQFEIYQRHNVQVVWSTNKLVYNGKEQLPTAYFQDEKGAKHFLKVEPAENYDCINAGEQCAEADFDEEDEEYEDLIKRYTLSNTEKFYNIDPLQVEIEWSRPNYDENGDPTGMGRVTVDPDSDEINLVFNGKAQAPLPRIVNIVNRGTEEDPAFDSVDLAVYDYNKNIEANTGYSAKVRLSGYDKGNYSLNDGDKEVVYNIVPHPVILEWESLKTVYNGKEQKLAKATVTNIQKAASGKKYPCEVGEYKYDTGKDFLDGEIGVDSPRHCIDAGFYPVMATTLLDSEGDINLNYTLDQYDNELGIIVEKELPVETYCAEYEIDQRHTSLKWDKTSVTYNASEQLPVATIKDLQSDKDGKDDAVTPVVTILTKDGAESYAVDTGTYIAKGNIEKQGELYKNYTLDKEKHNVWTENFNNFVINKKALTIKANNSKIYYRTKAVFNGYTYKGLVNGSGNHANTDMNANGEPTDTVFVDTSITKFVPLKDALVYTFGKYFKNAKYGKYPITVAFAKGVTARNYEVTFENGTLTVVDKKTALVAKGTKKGSTGIRISWKKVTGAKSYDVYFSICNTDEKKFVPKKIKTVKGTTYTVKKFKGKKLLKNTSYKYYVVAKDANGNEIAKSKEGHCITGNYNDDYTNARSMSTNKKSLTIKKGSTAVLSAKYVKANKSKILLDQDHSPLTRFVSENKKVATVDKKGNVLGVGKGWCRIYVIGTSGAWKAVEVTVK